MNARRTPSPFTLPVFASTLGTIAFVLALSLLTALPVAATVDLVTPAQAAATNHANLTFEYYPSMPAIGQCTLQLDDKQFQDITIQNASFNSFTVLNVDAGEHNWSVRCSNSTSTEYSVVRTLAVDLQAPSLVIEAPAENATVTEPTLSFTTTDDRSATLACSLSADNNYLTTIMAGNGSTENVSLNLSEGAHLLTLTCLDNATNGATLQRRFTLERPLTLSLTTDKASYGLGEQVLLTIDTLPEANLSIEVCPDEQGFVQCYTPLITPGSPQTITLPYTNTTGTYLIDGTALLGNRSATDSTSYTVDDTMSVHITPETTPSLGKTVSLDALATGGVGGATYKWTLHNGSLADGQAVTITYDAPGTWMEQVTATDSAGNTASANYTVTITPVREFTVKVFDDTSGKPLDDATVQLGDSASSTTLTTDSQGEAPFTIEQGRYDLFVSKEGYDYYYGSVDVAENESVTVRLAPKDNQKPVVTLLAPTDGATLRPPVTVSFHVKEQSVSTCTVNYAKEDARWAQQGATIKVTPDSDANSSLTALEEAHYKLFVECTDANGNVGQSAQRSFTVDQAAARPEGTERQNGSVWDEQDPLALVDQAYGAYDSFNAQQRELADLLGFEQRIKEAKLAIERAARDRESLTFRRDLSESEKKEKRVNLTRKIAAAQATIPLDLAILERKEEMSYLSPDDLAQLAGAIADEKGYAFTPERLAAFLAKVQNEFTVKTIVYRAKILLPGNKQEPLSVVTHALAYRLRPDATGGTSATGYEAGTAAGTGEKDALGGGAARRPGNRAPGGGVTANPSLVDQLQGTYTLYEAVPSGMAQREEELTILQAHKTLHEQPLALEFGPEQRITYLVEKDVPIATLLSAKTVLLKKPSLDEMKQVTGHAFLAGTLLDWKLSLLLTLLLALLILVVRKLDLLRHLKYLLYMESGKGGLHALKTLVNDGIALLQANDLEQAMMRYKEAKLEYERLGEYARNEAYPPLLELKEGLDNAYFNLLTRRIQEATAMGRYADAIDDYERLEATFRQLRPDEQAGLIAIVTELGRRVMAQTNGSGAASPGAERLGVVRLGATAPDGNSVGGGRR